MKKAMTIVYEAGNNLYVNITNKCCNHFHFYLCALYRVSLANHGTEHAVTAEVGITCYEQVSQISRVVDGTLYWMHGVEQAVHFQNGVRYEYRLEIVAILQAVADTGCDGINVLQYRCIFYTHDIRIHRCLDVVSCQLFGEYLRFLHVLTTDGQVGEAFEKIYIKYF